MSQKTIALQMMPTVLAARKKETEVTNGIPALTLESSEENPKIIVIDTEGIVCSPAKKRAKIIDTERIIMGEELTDLEINLAQQLLKKQFANINGLQSTLLQDKGPWPQMSTTTNSVLQRLKTFGGSNKHQLCRW